MSEKFPVNNFERIKGTSQFNDDLLKNYHEESAVQYFEKLHEPHNDSTFLTERMKIEKFGKFVANLHDKTEYVIHISKH